MQLPHGQNSSQRLMVTATLRRETQMMSINRGAMLVEAAVSNLKCNRCRCQQGNWDHCVPCGTFNSKPNCLYL